MDLILFERQEAALCAQHALNMLIQDSIFSPEQLSVIARRLDIEENSMLEQNAVSQNMTDSGYFSIQVIAEALKAFDLEIHNIEHPSMVTYKSDPLKARAFLCNHNEHWFVLRKFGNQWFELNSIKNGPKLLSDTYVGILLHQLNAEGYSIFVVVGQLPESLADQVIALCPVEPSLVKKSPPKESNMIQKLFDSVGRKLGTTSNISAADQEEKDLAIAMAMSMGNETPSSDEDMEIAIRASIADFVKQNMEAEPSTSQQPSTSNQDFSSYQEKIEETPILSNKSNDDKDELDQEKSIESIEKKD
ncbi:unnamed protein product [Caenorhabditis bovis]|uniref:ubiquitinyl hydrolase 1 n=1 Tax=Caenorhabditis bovis TaxID=2654633 RepID=A0A8S1E971_9PELO|nr:unnamed protein product [Caenorhabditis bovis]